MKLISPHSSSLIDLIKEIFQISDNYARGESLGKLSQYY